MKANKAAYMGEEGVRGGDESVCMRQDEQNQIDY